MKKEELFDLLENVDQKYINEAMFDDLGGDSPAVARPGKVRITPMKIIAPVAACLAVAAAAGFLVVNVDRGKQAVSPASASENIPEATESTDPDNNDNSAILSKWTFPAYDPVLVEECENVVMSTFPQALSSDLTWQVNSMDVDFDGFNELLLCPRIDGCSVNGVGVCVFQLSSGSAEYIGSFGGEFTSMNLDNFYIAPNVDAKFTYYFNNNEENGNKCVNSIQKLYVDNGIVQDETYLRLVRTHHPGDGSSDAPYTEIAYRYGADISTDRLLSEWKNTGVDVLPAMNEPDPHYAMSEQVQLLVEKYDVPLNGGSPASLHRNVMFADIDNDGEDETVIQFRNCEQLPGIYVFSADGELIGELDPEGERGEHWGTGLIDNISQILSVDIFQFDDGSESFYYYISTHVDTENNGLHQAAQRAINKIVVNDDGTLGTEKVIEEGAHLGEAEQFFKIKGNEVSIEEHYKEERKYPVTREFVW